MSEWAGFVRSPVAGAHVCKELKLMLLGEPFVAGMWEGTLPQADPSLALASAPHAAVTFGAAADCGCRWQAALPRHSLAFTAG